MWLGLPWFVALGFGLLAGIQVFVLFWLVHWLHASMFAQIEKMRWQGNIFFRRGLITLCPTILSIVLFLLWGQYTLNSIWWKSLWMLFTLSFGTYAFFSLLSAALLHIQVYGTVDVDFAQKVLSRIFALQLLLILLPSFCFSNFVLGMTWWHNRYVTDVVRHQVQKRHHTLQTLRLKSLFDRNGKHLGLFSRSESDWSPHYNDPNLLQWKLSQAIMTAEGRVRTPAWWWLYLPNGDQLLSEPFSLGAFLRVPYYFIKQRRKVGGSTPALQAAKNFIDFGGRRQGNSLSKTVKIKLFEEIPRSYLMSQYLTPREMMATYMATLWSGYSNHYGIHRMSLYYFGQPNPAKLTWNQAVVLAASLPNTGFFNPWYLSSCRTGKCSTPRRQTIYDTWNERIRQLKQKLRRNHKISIPEELPTFRNKLRRLRVLSRKTMVQDSHLRRWIQKEIPEHKPQWAKASALILSFDHQLMFPTPHTQLTPPQAPTSKPTSQTNPKQTVRNRPEPSRLALAKAHSFLDLIHNHLRIHRKQLPSLQIAYSLVDARKGMIFSQYGGDLHFDMALAGKPVVGSTFKVMVLLAASEAWPRALP
ncbi:MAG: transglycosylase domain-containing protein, partial [Myxococcota bacterium]